MARKVTFFSLTFLLLLAVAWSAPTDKTKVDQAEDLETEKEDLKTAASHWGGWGGYGGYGGYGWGGYGSHWGYPGHYGSYGWPHYGGYGYWPYGGYYGGHHGYWW